MKKALLIAAAIVLAAATPFQVRTLLEEAVNNERSAAARYEAFAAKAVTQGNLGAASLFRAAAHAEQIHADRFAKAMSDRGLTPPDPHASHPPVGDTADNIRAAALAEAAERDGIYHDAIEAANASGDQALAKIFDQSRDTEVEHANLLAALLRNQSLLTTAKTYYECGACGYTPDIALPLCALCRSSRPPRPIE